VHPQREINVFKGLLQLALAGNLDRAAFRHVSIDPERLNLAVSVRRSPAI
jgi:hypothetical protein